jgi:hypothetical protein
LKGLLNEYLEGSYNIINMQGKIIKKPLSQYEYYLTGIRLGIQTG